MGTLPPNGSAASLTLLKMRGKLICDFFHKVLQKFDFAGILASLIVEIIGATCTCDRRQIARQSANADGKLPRAL
jgi:hypothetical protein